MSFVSGNRLQRFDDPPCGELDRALTDKKYFKASMEKSTWLSL
jgi:hypothetical protein